MSLSPQWLDELRTRITLSGLIGRTVRVQKAGREFKACCPFHNEKSPSFTINDDKGFYHCFGCGAHGDAIRWMTDHQGLPFMDAVKELAAIANMEVPAPDPRAAQRAEAAKTLHDTMAAAQEYFRTSLSASGGAAARAYLATRGFPAAVVDAFGFGFAPDSRTGIKSALASFGDAQLVECGLLIAVEGRDPYDRFRGRLMLPIHDSRGRVIAFGGRILSAEKTASGDKGGAPKYLNSPDTPLFDKGRTLYNLHRAAPIARTRNRVIVVEGYMDAVALAAAGIVEAVAPLGTALTEDQIERLWQVAPCPVLCFDGDAAGQRAAKRAITRALPLLKPGHSLSIVTLPGGMDPDDVIKKQGPAAMEAMLGQGTTLIEALWQTERDAAPVATPEAKAGLKQRLIEATDTIQHPDIRSLYRRELLDRFDALAYPSRERGNWSRMAGNAPRRGTKDAKGRWLPPEQPLGATDTARLQTVGHFGKVLAPLLNAVLAGLVAKPGEISRHAEALAHLEPGDAEMAHLLDALLHLGELADRPDSPHPADSDERRLESTGLGPILAERGARVPDSGDFGGLPYGAIAAGDADLIAEAVELLVEMPRVEAAMAQATQALENELSEHSFAEQQRLVQRRLALRARLGHMGRARAAL